MLRNFHYIDEKGKDQGINVRNRANELASLLSDVDRIRAERRKAKSNRNKYQGVEGGMFNTASGSRYGGFGSDAVRAGGGGGGGGSSSGGWARDEDEYRGGSSRAGGSNFHDTAARNEYDEYEGADDFDGPPRRTTSATASTSRPARTSPAPSKPPKAQPPKAKAPEVNLFDFDDEPVSAPTAAPAAPAAPVDAFGDDDFDDFQQAPNASAPAPTSPPAAGGANANLFALLEAGKSSAAPAPTPSFSAPAPAPVASPTAPPAYSGMGVGMGMAQQRPAAAPAPKKPASAFDDLFTTSLGAPVVKPASAGGNKTIAEMEKEKASSGLWGSTPTASASAAKPAASSGFDDLLL